MTRCTAGLLQKWQCGDNIVAVAFDSTAANTVHLTAACVATQDDSSELPCGWDAGNHMGEVLLGYVFDALKLEV